jgi:hypothetical protein
MIDNPRTNKKCNKNTSGRNIANAVSTLKTKAAASNINSAGKKIIAFDRTMESGMK